MPLAADGPKRSPVIQGSGKLLSQKDAQFERNYTQCKANDIPVGAVIIKDGEVVASAVNTKEKEQDDE